ncbi:MAG TPA: two-component system response regulator [Nitrospiraceae bacterium]|nr:two-component system response regulator [Nitrospiraceae bacterium]
MKNNKPILLVEDDVVDQMTVQRAMKDLNVVNRLDIAGNGEEALERLRSSGAEWPCIILLDLNMPRMNGIEFLNAVKKDESLKAIPVVVLSTSKEDIDKIESFKLGVAGYMVKPTDYMQFVDVMKTIRRYWTLSELPGT